MPALINQALKPEMGTDVLALLRQLVQLPDRGIVAGQAVTSALLRLYGDSQRQGPINDVDVFTENPVLKNRLRMNFGLPQHKASGVGVNLRLPGDDGDYKVITLPHMTSRKGLAITAVTREGLLNFVHCNAPALGGGSMQNTRLRPVDVLSSFDLNGVEAGVDLQTGRLSWSRDFAWFIKTAQLQVTNVHGEVHTLTRIHKKLGEMPWIYCDLPATQRALMFTLGIKEALAETHSTADKKPPETSGFLPLLGPMYMERVRVFSKSIATGFDVEPLQALDGGPVLHMARSKVPVSDDVFSVFGPLHEVVKRAKTSQSNNFGREARHLAIARVLPLALSQSAGMSYRVGLINGAALEKRAAAMHRAVDHFIVTQEAQKELRLEAARQRAADAGEVFQAWRHAGAAIPAHDATLSVNSLKLQGDAYLAGQVDERTVSNLESFIHKHHGLHNLMAGLPLQDQITAMRNLQMLEKKHGGFVIGLVETTHPTSDAITPLALLNPEVLDERLQVLIDHLNHPIDVPPLPGQKSFDGGGKSVKLTELLTPMALRLEGDRMKHCVGGYASKVRSGASRIVQLTSGKSVLDCSTLELSITESAGLWMPQLVQHRGFANGDIPQWHSEAARDYLSCLASALNTEPADRLANRLLQHETLLRSARFFNGEIRFTLKPLSPEILKDFWQTTTSMSGSNLFSMYSANTNKAIECAGQPKFKGNERALLEVKSTRMDDTVRTFVPVQVSPGGLILVPDGAMREIKRNLQLSTPDFTGSEKVMDVISAAWRSCMADCEYQTIFDFGHEQQRKPFSFKALWRKSA